MTPQQAEAMMQMGAAISAGGYPQPAPSYRPVAFFKGERVSGFNKMCFYDRVGSVEAVNFPSTSICPLQIP